MTEAEIKSLIKDTLKQELKNIQKDVDDMKSKQKKLTDEDMVREIVRATMVNMYKFLWQKSSMYIKQI